MVKAQMKIQQMAFMILAVFFFFVLVGLFFLSLVVQDLRGSAERLRAEQAISSLRVIADMTELNFDSSDTLTIDEDKLKIMSTNLSQKYSMFLPVSYIRVYKIHPSFEKEIKCPAPNCNYYELFSSNQKNTLSYSTYVSICTRVNEDGYVQNKCEIGKIYAGVIKNEK
jgi:hypothetical protein